MFNAANTNWPVRLQVPAGKVATIRHEDGSTEEILPTGSTDFLLPRNSRLIAMNPQEAAIGG